MRMHPNMHTQRGMIRLSRGSDRGIGEKSPRKPNSKISDSILLFPGQYFSLAHLSCKTRTRCVHVLHVLLLASITNRPQSPLLALVSPHAGHNRITFTYPPARRPRSRHVVYEIRSVPTTDNRKIGRVYRGHN